MRSRGRKSILIFLIGLAVVGFSLFALFNFPNPLEEYIVSEAKAHGYIDYTPREAKNLATKICTQCHSLERIKLYCPRCGPPFVAVVPHMQTFIENYKATKPNLKFISITEHQAVAIVQVWNALIGNWELDFREQDMMKLIGHYELLKDLYKTPVEQRKIEYALMSRDDLKIGHMSGLMEMQRNLGKSENNPLNPCGSKVDGMSGMEDMQMKHPNHQNNPRNPCGSKEN